jgi:hypothetical protein
VERIELPTIDLAAQRRIAEILDTIGNAIRFTERLIAKLEQMTQGLLHDLLTRGIDFDGQLREPVPRLDDLADTSIDARHARWSQVSRRAGAPTLAELVAGGDMQLGRGKVISAIDIERCPGPYPIYSSSASGSGEFGRYGEFMFNEPLITWSVDGGGRPFLRRKHKFSVTNVGGFLRVLARDQWDYRYVHAVMAYQHSRLTFDWQMKAHPSVIRDLYVFPRIPLDEQVRVADALDVAMDRTAAERSLLQKLRLLKDGLTDNLLTGRARVSPGREDAA